MAKIIKISNDIVFIGMDDGGIKEVRMSDINYAPNVGDEVEMFETENTVIVSKKNVTRKSNNMDSGININVSNNQNTVQPNYSVPTTTNTKAVNKVTYCILALFLGGIGVHKFYSGKTGTGLLYLIFCWTCIPLFLALIDLIVGICAKSDARGNILV